MKRGKSANVYSLYWMIAFKRNFIWWCWCWGWCTNISCKYYVFYISALVWWWLWLCTYQIAHYSWYKHVFLQQKIIINYYLLRYSIPLYISNCVNSSFFLNRKILWCRRVEKLYQNMCRRTYICNICS